ncbi:hypothetical protein O6H91_09G074200 [Diphasiastrum complanatum]|nr:hypothetical protein O6H91_09G074200 [Diphasiastrum complanatum]KAJ7544340.1 hypothetical protein O6H91_09G074200 [Diphasiastrum complanatum]
MKAWFKGLNVRVGLLGPNGAGNSTAFSIMVGRQRPTSGVIRLGLINITDYPLQKRARLGIGYMTQELLEGFCLDNVRHTLGRALSGGERHRTELARSLASNCSGGPPSILLVDEPFAGVDPIGVNEIQIQLRRLCEAHQMGILITDHKVNETLDICNRAYVVHKGQVMAYGKPDDIYNNQYVKEHYLGERFQRL